MNLLVVLEPETAGHVAIALVRHLRWAREGGTPVPATVREIAEAATSAARSRQEPTTVAALEALVEGARMSEPLLLPYDSAAGILGLSHRTVERMVAAGELPSVAVGGRRLIRRVDLVAYVDGLVPGRLEDSVEHKAPGAAGAA